MAETDVLMPQMGESIQEATLTTWHKKLGDTVESEETLFEISTDKVDSEVPAPVSGTIVKIMANEGDVVQVNSVVAVIDDAKSAVVQKAEVKSQPKSQAQSEAPSQTLQAPKDDFVQASPLARKVAKEHNVDLNSLSVPEGAKRIGKDDVLQALQNTSPSLLKQSIEQATSPVKTASVTHMQQTGGASTGVIDGVRSERVPMTAMRRKIAEHMVKSKAVSPHVTSVIEVDFQKIVDIRTQNKDAFLKAHGFKLSYMPFFLHAVIQAIQAVPVVNSSVDGNSIIYKKDINLGIAVALDWGLIVPVIKNTTEKSFVGLARELDSLAKKARSKKLTPDDVRGGTFSITNFGSFGTIIGQPIINQPQAAIFGIGALKKKPVVINDAIAIRTTCHCVLSFDHRIIDGADSGKFLSTVKETLENWSMQVI